MDKSQEKKALRKRLVDERIALTDRDVRCDLLQRVMRIWLVNRPDTVIGAYWPIKGEFDPLPAFPSAVFSVLPAISTPCAICCLYFLTDGSPL